MDDLDREYRDAIVLDEHGVQGIGISLPREFRQVQELKRIFFCIIALKIALNFVMIQVCKRNNLR